MNYRHAYHAGNFADVVKHVALVAILLHLRKKQAPFAAIDSHAGGGLYDLGDDAATATGEAQDGIGRLRDLAGDIPQALAVYLKLVADAGAHRYPGSPLLAAKLLRPQDRLVAIERNPEEAVALAAVLAPYRKARAETADGHARLLKLLPPPERRGLVLIDPPFEAPDEFEVLARTARDAYRRFATGTYLLWYPVKSPGAADSLCGEVLAAGIARAMRIEITVAPEGDGLARAGLLLLNPPYGFGPAMKDILALLAPLLGRDGPARVRVERLAGED
jgi:23S rRNA (adenine2030-N6)-methyltransferase